MSIDQDKIERFFALNENVRAYSFEFLDKNAQYASKSKKQYVKVIVGMMNGEIFEFSKQEFESFDDRKIHVGFLKQETN